MNRKATPDILGALMGETIKPENQVAVEQESAQAIKPPSKKEIKQVGNKAIKQAHFDGMEPPEGSGVVLVEKEKATFNLSKAVLGELEDCWIEIRKLRGDKKISKTDIVEQAVEEAIKDFKLKKELSKFYSKLESNKASKQ